ncbi:MAG: hypothetical protein ABSG81_13245 [Acidimicrobiales bacterium]
MRRLHAIATRLALAGLAALSLGVALVVGALAQGSGAPAFADSAPYELICPGTPVGNIALNDVVTTGTITPAAPALGQAFNLTDYQSTVALPAQIVTAAAALGNSAIAGSATTGVDATGASPATTADGPFDIDAPIPSPVPSTGLSLTLPSVASTVGPFTATGSTITLTVDKTVNLTLNVSGSDLALTCNPYPNDTDATGILTTTPPSSEEISPVIAVATAGSGPTTTTFPVTTTSTTQASTTTTTSGTTTTTTPSTALTGPYELYCPGTPVGDVALNGAETSATLSPASPTAGQSFSVTGYQTTVNLPQSLASAAQALQPDLQGSATTQVDASGATPTTTSVGPLNFDVPIPTPVPSAGVTLTLPATAASLGPFTAASSTITIQEDAAASLTLDLAGSALTLTCNAYPDNSVVSGIVTTAPAGPPLAPVIAVATGTTPPTTVPPVTTTTVSPTSTTTAPVTSTTIIPPASTTTVTVTPVSTTTTPETSSTTTAPGASSTTTAATTTAPTTTAAPTTTGAPTTSSPSPAVAAQVQVAGVTASSQNLAFTGTGNSVRDIALVGGVLIALGASLLVLADAPRRALAWAVTRPRVRRHRSVAVDRAPARTASVSASASATLRTGAERAVAWLLGRSPPGT